MKTIHYIYLMVSLIGLTLLMACNKAPTCSDGIQNQGERGIDCSGPCANENKICNCFNGFKDGEETDIDCGGSYCGSCEDVDEIKTCLEMLSENLTYQIDGETPKPGVSNAFINKTTGNLLFTIKSLDGLKSIFINQTVSGLMVGDYSVNASGVTAITFTDADGSFYTSQVQGSDGQLVFSEFKRDIDCKYLSGTLDVLLFNTSKSKSISVSSNFTEVKFK